MTDEQRTDERRKLAPELVAIHARLDTGDVRMSKMENCLSENTAMDALFDLAKQIEMTL